MRRLLEDGAERFNSMAEQSEGESWTTLCDRFKDALPSLAPPGKDNPALRAKAAAVVPLKRARTSSSSAGYDNEGGRGNGHLTADSQQATYDQKQNVVSYNTAFDSEMSALESMSMFGAPDFGVAQNVPEGPTSYQQHPRHDQTWTSPSDWSRGGQHEGQLLSFGPTPQEMQGREHMSFAIPRQTSNVRGHVPDDNDPPESSSTGMKRQAFEVNYTSSFW